MLNTLVFVVPSINFLMDGRTDKNHEDPEKCLVNVCVLKIQNIFVQNGCLTWAILFLVSYSTSISWLPTDTAAPKSCGAKDSLCLQDYIGQVSKWKSWITSYPHAEEVPKRTRSPLSGEFLEGLMVFQDRHLTFDPWQPMCPRLPQH